MKKILVLLAAAMLVFACGGSSDKKGQTVEEKAAEYFNKMMKAREADDWDKMEAIGTESTEWYLSLSEDDRMKADKAYDEARNKYYSSDMGDGEYEYDEYDYDEYEYGDYDDYDYEDYDEYDYDDYDYDDYDDYDYDYDEEW